MESEYYLISIMSATFSATPCIARDTMGDEPLETNSIRRKRASNRGTKIEPPVLPVCMHMYIFVPPLCRRGTIRVGCTVAPAWQPGDFIFGDLPIPLGTGTLVLPANFTRLRASPRSRAQTCCRRFYRLSKLHRGCPSTPTGGRELKLSN